MKKILFLLLICFISIINVNAFTGVKEYHGHICDINHVYDAITVNVDGEDMYFLTPNTEEGYNLNDYSYDEVLLDNTPFGDNDLESLAFAEIINDKLFATKYLWTHMYPDHGFYFCDDAGNMLGYYESQYEMMLNNVEKVRYGLGLRDTDHYLSENELFVYGFDYYLSLFDLVSPEVETFIFSPDRLIFGTAHPGKYELSLNLHPNSSVREDIYTNGTDYLMFMPQYKYEHNYNFNIYVGYKKISVTNFNEETIIFTDNNGNDYEYLGGDIYLLPGVYDVRLDSEENKILEQTIEVTQDEEFTFHYVPINSISFVPENTLDFMGILMLIILMIVYVIA